MENNKSIQILKMLAEDNLTLASCYAMLEHGLTEDEVIVSALIELHKQVKDYAYKIVTLSEELEKWTHSGET